MSSFFMTDAQALVRSSPSMQLHQLLDWQAIDRQRKGLYKRELSGAGGPEPYLPLGMFRLMPLASGMACPMPSCNTRCAYAWTSWSSRALNPVQTIRPTPTLSAVSGIAWSSPSWIRNC